MIKVLNGGLLTTVQDLGRFGHQLFGISTAGPMDTRSFRLANLLAGNGENAAALEVTLMGPTLEFEQEAVFAITGGDLQPHLSGKPISMYYAVLALPGDVLQFSGVRSGCRSYIAFAGGIDVPPLLGSRATYLRAAMGGYQGRKLAKGDTLFLLSPDCDLAVLAGRSIPNADFSQKEVTLRVILGPQDDRFTEEGLKTFTSSGYTVGNEFDRMGYRLTGPVIQHSNGADIISDGIACGSIQVPGSGLPIIMTADRQPMGGYTKIANVISVDLPLLSQRKPGNVLRFQPVTVQEAQTLYLQELEELAQLESQAKTKSVMKVWMDGVWQDATIQEI